MRFVTRCSFIALFLAAAAFASPHSAIPSLTAQANDGSQSLALQSMRIEILIRGHLARTTYELTYASALDRDTDGDFVFPLPVDAEVSDLALYFGDHLRHAVAVERVQARAAYESTIHKRVDPALAEWSASTRAFHFRVYPIPAHGTKVVHIAIDHELTTAPYELDLRYGVTLQSFDLKIDSDVNVDTGNLARHATNIRLDHVIRARRDDAEVALAAFSNEDKTWYASAPVRVHSIARDIEPASHVTLLYDVSSSAVQRDDAKLRAFLSAFLAKQRDGAAVSVIPFHIDVEAALATSAAGLERTLAAIPLAGATNLVELLEKLPSIMSSSPAGSRILIVTDGINTLGDSQRLARATQAFAKLRRPLTLINASPSPDDTFLGSLARQTGGSYIDLTHLDPNDAAESAMRLPTKMNVMTQLPLRDMLPSLLNATSDFTATFSARSTDPFTSVPVITTNGRREVPLRVLDAPAEADLVRRAWARARLRSLIDAGAKPDEIYGHGRAFNQLTPRTSLLVLDSWRDYELNGVPMPPDVRAERDADVATRVVRQQSTITLTAPMDFTVPRDAKWFIKGRVVDRGESVPLPGVTVRLQAGNVSAVTVTDVDGRFWLALPAPPTTSFTITAELIGFGQVMRSYPKETPKGSVAEIVLGFAGVSEAITVTGAAPLIESDSTQINAPRANASIRAKNANIADQLLSALASDAPLPDDEEQAAKSIEQRLDLIDQVVAKLKSLRSIDDRFRYYTAARGVVGGDKLFQTNAALAVRDDAPNLATRWLTDLAEAYPDDAATLRILGRVLDAWGRDDLARLMFERAFELAPREAQTQRELTLLGAKERREKDEPRRDETAEMQVESMWDSNFTDVDLHVIEPDGEEVFYGHMKSKHDGALDSDVQNGYGPETYAIPHLQQGPYRIVLHYYAGDTTQIDNETLVHVIVFVRGVRRDLFVALTNRDDKRVVAVINP